MSKTPTYYLSWIKRSTGYALWLHWYQLTVYRIQKFHTALICQPGGQSFSTSHISIPNNHISPGDNSWLYFHPLVSTLIQMLLPSTTQLTW